MFHNDFQESFHDLYSKQYDLYSDLLQFICHILSQQMPSGGGKTPSVFRGRHSFMLSKHTTKIRKAGKAAGRRDLRNRQIGGNQHLSAQRQTTQ